MKNVKLSFAVITLMLVFSCSKDSTNDLVATPAQTNTLVKFGTDIKSITDGNCVGCHANPPVNGAPMPLTTFADVKDAVQNRGLIDRISRAQGASGLMPRGGTRLPQASIDKITKWQTDGFQQ